MPFLKRHKLLLSVLILAAGLYFLSIPVLLWRAHRDLDLAKNHQETFLTYPRWNSPMEQPHKESISTAMAAFFIPRAELLFSWTAAAQNAA